MNRKNKLFLGIISSAIFTLPFVAADIRSGPEIFIVPILGLIWVGACVFLAIGLIKWIIYKIKKKQ